MSPPDRGSTADAPSTYSPSCDERDGGQFDFDVTQWIIDNSPLDVQIDDLRVIGVNPGLLQRVKDRF
jgi:hypothetical protein